MDEQETSNPSQESWPKAEKIYVGLCSLFVVVLVLTNIVGVKLFILPWMTDGDGNAITLTTGIITYPLTFLITDTVSEIYGRKRADFMVWLGFALSMVMLAVVALSVGLPGSEVWINKDLGYQTVPEMQRAFESVFTLPGTLVLGSMSAYLCAQLLDNRLFHFWKGVTKGKHLWLRNNGSTVLSQLVDTIVVNSIFLGWGMGVPWPVVWQIIWAIYICKIMLALVDTPLVYLAVGTIRRYLRTA